MDCVGGMFLISFAPPEENDRSRAIGLQSRYASSRCRPSSELTITNIVNTIDNMPDDVTDLEALIWELRRTFRELTVAADRALEDLGIQAGDRALLEFLSKEEQPISLSDLARKYSVSRQHIHQGLSRLPDPGWIDRVQDSNDARTILVRLSRKGQSQWQKIQALDRRFLNRISQKLERREVEAATRLLRRIRQEIATNDRGQND